MQGLKYKVAAKNNAYLSKTDISPFFRRSFKGLTKLYSITLVSDTLNKQKLQKIGLRTEPCITSLKQLLTMTGKLSDKSVTD